MMQLKAKVEVETGLKAATLAIYLPAVAQPLGQNATLADCGLPSILYTLTLHKIVIADMVDELMSELTDVQLAKACSTDEGRAGDIVGLAGCDTLRDVSCLVWLEQMQELDISGCMNIDATTVAKVVTENGALLTLIFGGDDYYDSGQRVKYEPATLTVDMTEANFSNKNLGPGGAIIIASWISNKDDKGALSVLDVSNNGIGHCDDLPSGWSLHLGNIAMYRYKHTDGRHQESAPDGAKSTGAIAISNAIRDMGALSVTNVMGNKIGKEQLAKLQEIMRSKPNLVSLCGIADDATEANLSGLGMDADDASILASELPDKGALSSLSLTKNALLTKEAGKVIGDMLKSNSTLKELDLASNCDNGAGAKDGPGFAQELADGIKDNGALTLTSLNVANNNLGGLFDMANNTWSFAHNQWYCNHNNPPADNKEGYTDAKPLGIIALVNAIKDMGAMTSLNLASNSLCAEGAQVIAEAIKVTKCTVYTCDHFGTIFMSI
jgi:hypothetical protein